MPFDPFLPRPFTSVSVKAFAPQVAGVYGLSNGREWVYIEQTDNIQSSLLGHLQELNSPPVDHAPTGFVFEICAGAQSGMRKDRLISEYEPARNPRVLRAQ